MNWSIFSMKVFSFGMQERVFSLLRKAHLEKKIMYTHFPSKFPRLSMNPWSFGWTSRSTTNQPEATVSWEMALAAPSRVPQCGYQRARDLFTAKELTSCAPELCDLLNNQPKTAPATAKTTTPGDVYLSWEKSLNSKVYRYFRAILARRFPRLKRRNASFSGD